MNLIAKRANNMSKTLDQLTTEVVKIFNSYDKQGTNTWDYKTAAFDLTYQLGSLAKRISQLEGNRYADGLSREQIVPLVADELADILAEVLFIAHDLKIDMNASFEAMIASDTEKIKLRS